jgi:phosphosulfolactate synthase
MNPALAGIANRPPRPLPAPSGQIHATDYLKRIGVHDLPPRTAPLDAGYDPLSVESHLEQSAHLMETLKISNACWMIADENVTRRKVTAARFYSVPTVTGGGPFGIAVAQGQLEAYLDLCADIGVSRIECGPAFANLRLNAESILRMAGRRNLEVQFELRRKQDGGSFEVDQLIDQGQRWLDAGAVKLVVDDGFSGESVDRLARTFGLEALMFQALNGPSQFALLDHFGRGVHLCSVRLEELLQVEIYRRGLHSDAFGKGNLRPDRPRRRASLR